MRKHMFILSLLSLSISSHAQLEVGEKGSDFSIGFGSGWSYRLAKVGESVPEEQKKYMEELKSGLHLAADIAYFFTEKYGIGLAYNQFFSSNSMAGAVLTDQTTGQPIVGNLKDEVSILFLGPVFAGRTLYRGGGIVVTGLVGLGYLSFHDDGQFSNAAADIEATTAGLLAGLSLEFRLMGPLALGAQLRLVNGSTEEVTVNGQKVKTNERESFNRLDAGVSLRFLP